MDLASITGSRAHQQHQQPERRVKLPLKLQSANCCLTARRNKFEADNTTRNWAVQRPLASARRRAQADRPDDQPLCAPAPRAGAPGAGGEADRGAGEPSARPSAQADRPDNVQPRCARGPKAGDGLRRSWPIISRLINRVALIQVDAMGRQSQSTTSSQCKRPRLSPATRRPLNRVVKQRIRESISRRTVSAPAVTSYSLMVLSLEPEASRPSGSMHNARTAGAGHHLLAGPALTAAGYDFGLWNLGGTYRA
jgi:hypothetical protein